MEQTSQPQKQKEMRNFENLAHFFVVEKGGKIADSQVLRDLKNTFIVKILNQRTYICFDKLF